MTNLEPASIPNADPNLARRLTAWLAAWLAVALLLAAWRRDTIASPPYWDAAIGLFMEADFLVESHFDYQRLRLQEKSVWDGGSRTYVTSILPTFVAALMLVCPTPRSVFVVYHLFVYGCAALVLVTQFRLLRGPCGNLGALLATILTAVVPVFSVQIEMLGMELPVAAAALLWTEALLAHRSLAAVFWTAVAYAFKATGAVLTFATFAFLTLRLMLPNARRVRDAAALVLSLFLLAAELAIVRWNNIGGELLMAAHRNQIAGLSAAVAWCPDLVVMLALSAIGSLLVAATWLFRHRLADIRGALTRRDVQLAAICWLAVVGILLAMARVIFIPRYATVAIPFLVMLLALLAMAVPDRRRLAAAFFVAAIAFQLANQHGRFYAPLVAEHGPLIARTGALLERSLEYRADHQANQDLVAYMAKHLADERPFVGSPLVYFLTLPRLGYVDRPLAGYLVNDFTDRSTHFRHPVVASLDDCPEYPVFVWLANTHYELSRLFDVPQPANGDEILFEDTRFGSPLLFRKRWSGLLPSRDERMTWYMGRLLPLAPAADRAAVVGLHLAATGQTARAIPALRQALELEPRDAYLKVLLADHLTRDPQANDEALQEAERLCRQALEAEPDDALGHLVLARALERQDRPDEARAAQCQAQSISPRPHDPFTIPAAASPPSPPSAREPR